MNVKRTPKGEAKPAPTIIDAVWEPAPGEPLPEPPTMFEAIARDAERIGRSAHAVMDEVESARQATRRIFSAARGVFDRFRSDVRIGDRAPLGR
jgi:hypothetical protein